MFPFLGADPVVNKLRQLGEQKETLTRICHELPGYNWLEEKIRKTATNDHPTTQTSSSTTTTTSTLSSLNTNEDVEDNSTSSQSKPTTKTVESDTSQE